MSAQCSVLRKKGAFYLLSLLGCTVFVVWMLDVVPRCYQFPLQKEPHAAALRHTVPQQSHSDGTERELLYILQRKLSELSEEEAKSSVPDRLCSTLQKEVGRCVEDSCPANLSTRPADRLTEILRTRGDEGSTGHYLAAMERSVAGIKPHKFVFVTASSHHYHHKLNTLVNNLKLRLFPKVHDFLFLVFDLGLTAQQRIQTEKTCDCQVIDFPFSALPKFVGELRCYTWKPLIINALLPKSHFTVWMDTSVIWKEDANVTAIFQLLEQRGLLLGRDYAGTIALRTLDSMFQHFGDQSCQYEPYDEVYATYGLFRNELFVREAVLKPWVSCALKWTCMCVPGHMAHLYCAHKMPRKRSACHRFDQSALGIIVSKLYQDRRGLVTLLGGISIVR